MLINDLQFRTGTIDVDGVPEPTLVTARLKSHDEARAAGRFVHSADGYYVNLKFTPSLM